MRKLSVITAHIVPPPSSGVRSFARRPVRAVYDSLTCLVLVRHAENESEIFVSDDGDAVGAVWIRRAPILIDPRNRGHFLVVTLPRAMAQQKGLAARILDWERYPPTERAMLQDAVDAARRTRERLGGHRAQSSMGHTGRNTFA